jgi:uncharacterized membrane protein
MSKWAGFRWPRHPSEDRDGGRERSRRSARVAAIAVGAAFAYAVVLSGLGTLQHRGLRTQMNDLGNADQAMWAAANGDWLMTQSNTLDEVPRSRLGVHVNLVFLPLSLLYRAWPTPEMLLVLTSLACAAAGLGIFAFARRRLGDSWWALVPPLAFWASPIAQDANLYDFHVITITTALLVWAVWCFDAGRTTAGWVLLALALACKEDVAPVVFMYGVALWLSGSRRLGLWVAGVAAGSFLISVKLLVPLVTGGEALERLGGAGSRHAWLGHGPLEMLASLLRDPAGVLGALVQPEKLRLPLYLLLGGGIAALRAWRFLLLLLPPVVLAIFAEGNWMTRVSGTYYWITCEAIVILACVAAATDRGGPPGRIPGPLAYLAAATALATLLLSPLPYGALARWEHFAVGDAWNTLREVRTRVPADAALTVQNNLGPHFSQRRDVATYPRRLASADYALFHLRYQGGPRTGLFAHTHPNLLFGGSPDRLHDGMRELIESPEWALVLAKDGFFLFQRGGAAALSEEEARVRLEADYRTLVRQCRQAARSKRPWTRYLVGGLTWRDLV